DLVSVGQLVSPLDAYRGAFVVVSHDERLLADIRVQRRLELADGRLREIAADGGSRVAEGAAVTVAPSVRPTRIRPVIWQQFGNGSSWVIVSMAAMRRVGP